MSGDKQADAFYGSEHDGDWRAWTNEPFIEVRAHYLGQARRALEAALEALGFTLIWTDYDAAKLAARNEKLAAEHAAVATLKGGANGPGED